MPFKKCHILMSASCHIFNKWPLNAVLHKKLSRMVMKKLLVILHYSKSFKRTREVIRTQGKCIKTYKNFLKDFVVKQNLIHPKGDF